MTNIGDEGAPTSFTDEDEGGYCDYFTRDVKNCYSVG